MSLAELLASHSEDDAAVRLCAKAFKHPASVRGGPAPAAEFRRIYELRLRHLNDRSLVIAQSPDLLQTLDTFGEAQATIWITQDEACTFVAFTDPAETRLAGCFVIPKSEGPPLGEDGEYLA